MPDCGSTRRTCARHLWPQGAYFYRFEPATNKVFVGTYGGQKVKTFYVWDGHAGDAVISALKQTGWYW